MPKTAAIEDHITPIRNILESAGVDRRRELERYISKSRPILRAHLYNSLSGEQAVDELLDPNWGKTVRRFSVTEWRDVTDEIWSRASQILGKTERPEIILFPGFGRCNGRVYRVKGALKIVCSPDFALTTGINLKVLLAHEYGHFLRELKTGFRSDGVPIYALLYEEGWATWFSRQLFPEVPLFRIFMSNLHAKIGRADPAGGYVRWCRKHRATIAAEALGVLNSRDSHQLGRFFQGARFSSNRTPIRTGYYLGYSILKMLSQELSTGELLSLRATSRRVSRWIEEFQSVID